MIEDHHIARNGRPVEKPLRFSVKGVGNLEVEPDRRLSGDDDIVAIAGKLFDNLFYSIVKEQAAFLD